MSEWSEEKRMKNPLVRVFGGMVLGFLLLVPYFGGSFDPVHAKLLVGGLTESLDNHEVLQGVILGLIIFVLWGLGVRSVQRVQVRPTMVEAYRQRRLRHVQKIKAQRFY